MGTAFHRSYGSLEFINFASNNGMRGCYLATDYTDRYLFVAGYHDGKLTVLKLAEDGSVGDITDEIYHKGLHCLELLKNRLSALLLIGEHIDAAFEFIHDINIAAVPGNLDMSGIGVQLAVDDVRQRHLG